MFRPIRDVGVPVAVTVGAMTFGVGAVVASFVVFGYAHFIQGYWYKARRGFRDWVRLIVVPLVVFALFALYYSVTDALAPLFVLTAFIFAAHFAFDEYFLHEEAVRGVSWVTLGAFLGIDGFLSVALVLPHLMPYALAASIVLLVAMSVTLVSGALHTDRYLTLIGALLILMAAFGDALLMLGVVVLLHCVNWYVWGYERESGKGRRGAYIRDVAVVVGCIAGVFMLSLMVLPGLAVLFSVPGYHYVYFPLALAHIASSVRFPVA